MTPRKGPTIPGMKWTLFSPVANDSSGQTCDGAGGSMWTLSLTQVLPHAQQLVGHLHPHVSVPADAAHVTSDLLQTNAAST